MRYITAIFICVLYINSQGQNNNKIQNCDEKTLYIFNNIVKNYDINKFDTFDTLTPDLINQCGIRERMQRLIIIQKILKNKPSEDEIGKYFNNNFHNSFLYRIDNWEEALFEHQHPELKSNNGTIPLFHPIDSLIIKESLELLKSKDLTTDERITCTLFSVNIKEYKHLTRNCYSKKSVIKQHFNRNWEKFGRNWSKLTVYSGVFKPLGSKKIFSYSPFIGITASSPLSYKLVVEVGFKLRLNINDNEFDFYAFDKTNTVDSDYSVFGGAIVGYKIYESRKFKILPKLGFGYELVGTGLNKNDKESKNRYNVVTLHMSAGLAVMIPVRKSNYLGFGINYHYCPYSLEKNLHTTFNENLVSTEVFWRF